MPQVLGFAMKKFANFCCLGGAPLEFPPADLVAFSLVEALVVGLILREVALVFESSSSSAFEGFGLASALVFGTDFSDSSSSSTDS
jgi:hypothetical protein